MNIYNSSDNIIDKQIYEIDNINNNDKKYYIVKYIKDNFFFINLKVFIEENEFIVKSTLDELKSNNEFFSSKNNLNEINEYINKLILDSKKFKNPPKIDENENEYKFNLFPNNNDKIITFSFKKEQECNNNNFFNVLNEIEKDLSLLNDYNKKISDYESTIIKLNKEKSDLKIKYNTLKNDFKQIEKKCENLKQMNKKLIDHINKENKQIQNKNNESLKNNNESDKNFNINLNSIKSKNSKDLKNINITIKNFILTDEIKKNIMNYLPNKIKNFQYKKILSLLYKATRHGCLAKDFHNKVDNIGPLLIIIETTNNQIFGAFTSVAWSSKNDFVEDSEAFLFCNNNKYNVNNKILACYHHENFGPYFGDKALVITDNCLNNKDNFTDCEDQIYNFDNNTNLLNEEKNSFFQVKDYEVYLYK